MKLSGITWHELLTREALSEIAHMTTGKILNSETGAPFLEGTTL